MNKNLINMLKSAYEGVPYYHQLFDKNKIDVTKICKYEDFQKIPLLDKNTIRENPQDFINKNYCIDDLIRVTTSGSTGIVLPVFWSSKELLKSDMNLWRVRSKSGVFPMQRSCTFSITYRDLTDCEELCENVKFDSKRNKMLFNGFRLSSKDCMNYYKMLMEFEPLHIINTPSLLVAFVKCVNDLHLPCNHSVKYIELSGEYLSDGCRSQIQKFFVKAKIINQYGCREIGVIAIEDDMKNMHCFNDNVFVEVLKDGQPTKNNEEGDIYVTTLNNFAMPVIRYRIGDKGRFDKTNILEKSKEVLKISAGRECGEIILEDDSKMSSAIFWRVVNIINEKTNGAILQFNVIQKKRNLFVINLVVINSDFENIEMMFKEFLREYGLVGDYDLVFDYYAMLSPNLPTGKLKYFISEL